MKIYGLLAGAAAALAPVSGWAQVPLEADVDVFDGDYLIVGAGVASVPTYEGSNNGKIIPLLGAVGEVSGIGFSIRGPSLSLDVLPDRPITPGSKLSLRFGPQIKYRANRTGSVGDEVVAKLGKLDGVIEAGARAGIGIDDIVSTADKLSIGVSARWDISGKGSGYIVIPSATYRLPVSRKLAFGFLVSTQFVDGDYADYNYGITPEGAAASGLPEFDAKGGFKELTLGAATAYDLSGDFLDGGLALGLGLSYTRLFGSAAKTPITSIRGSRDQWVLAAGFAHSF